MSVLVRTRTPAAGRALTVAAATLLLLVTLFASGALAHGSATDPASRHYSCWERWGDDFQNADMESEDPMCWQAIQADPNVIWNWNGLYRENVAGNHEGTLPEGQLCSGGETDPRYAALDVPGPWTTTALDNDFTLTYNDAANHGADYYRVYVTEQGFDPTTDELGWGDLELVTETDVIAPGEGTPSPNGGTDVEIDVSAPGRTGHHIVYTIWQASHFDQTFYACSDVTFPGGDSSAPVAEEPEVPAEDLPEAEVPDAEEPDAEEPDAEEPEAPAEEAPESSDAEEPAGEEPEPETPEVEAPTEEEPGGGFDFDALLEQLLSMLTLLMSMLGV